MKSLIWHLVKKDWRQQWPLLALWWVMLVVVALGPLWLYHQALQANVGDFYNSDNPVFGDYNLSYGGVLFLFGVNFLVLVALATDIVQADTPLGDKAFWRTRPVTGAQVFAAKLLGLGLFCVLLPALLNVAAGIICGMGAETWWNAFFTVATVNAVCVLLAVTVAALCPRVLAAYLVLAPVVVMGVWLLAPMATMWPVEQLRESLLRSRIIVGGGLGLAGCVAAVVWMYARHRCRGAVFVLAAALALAVPAYRLWPWDFAARSLAGAVKDPQVSLEVEPTSFWQDGMTGGTGPFYLWAHLKRLEAATDEIVQMCALRGTITWPGGVAQTRFDHRQMMIGQMPFNVKAAIEAATSARLSAAMPVVIGWPDVSLACIPAEQADQAQQPGARWEGDFYFERGHFAIAADLPLAAGAQADTPTEKMGINGVITHEYRCFISLVALRPQSLFTALTPDLPLQVYVLVNRQLHEAKYLEASFNFDVLSAGTVVSTSRLPLYCDFYQPGGNGKPVPMSSEQTKQWVAGARLLVLRYEPLGLAYTTATLDRLTGETNPRKK